MAEKILKKIFKVIAFAAVIALNVFATGTSYSLEAMALPFKIGLAVLAVNFILSKRLTSGDYFVSGITAVAIPSILLSLWDPNFGKFYVGNILTGLYAGLFLMAVVPLCAGIRPFSFYISKDKYPDAVVQSSLFLDVNRFVTSIWAFLFFACMVLTVFPYYSEDPVNQIAASIFIPIAVQIFIGVPISRLVPKRLTSRTLPRWFLKLYPPKRIRFESMAATWEAMPLGLNKERAKGVDTVIQFEMSGSEPGTVHMIIKDQVCTIEKGSHPSPKTIIKCDSDLWLGITNGDISGDDAFRNNRYAVEGDMSILLRFDSLFSTAL